MKKLIQVLSLVFSVCAHAGTVTLVANTNETVELNLSQYETAELVSYPYTANQFCLLDLVKDGKTITIMAGAAWPEPKSTLGTLIVAGPATVRFRNAGSYPGICSFRVTPEAFPPDRALLVPPGTNQVQITLECSTNLVNWFAATNGIYGPLPEAKFFRIKLDKLQ